VNFDFSEEQQLLRDQAQRFLADRDARGRSRKLLDDGGGIDTELWQEIAALGWIGATLAEDVGGAALGYVDLCVIAEELGRANAAVPFASTVYLGAEAIARFGVPAQRSQYLPDVVNGNCIIALAAAEGAAGTRRGRANTQVRGGKVFGHKTPVTDGSEADLLLVLAQDEAGQGGESSEGLYLVEAKQNGVSTQSLEMTDGSRPAAMVTFDGASATRLGESAGWPELDNLFDRAAVLMAFEQIGGAQACLEMARDYALERYAFGRPIGSYQAIKHKLADVYIAIELARSNAYFGAWALAADAPDLPVAAAAARVGACRAFDLASKENIQTHGGMGFTWELDCHLYYRRAKALGVALGSARVWKDRLITRLEASNSS
jgi:acyl-CoA dehydrogenase